MLFSDHRDAEIGGVQQSWQAPRRPINCFAPSPVTTPRRFGCRAPTDPTKAAPPWLPRDNKGLVRESPAACRHRSRVYPGTTKSAAVLEQRQRRRGASTLRFTECPIAVTQFFPSVLRPATVAVSAANRTLAVGVIVEGGGAPRSTVSTDPHPSPVSARSTFKSIASRTAGVLAASAPARD